MLRFLTLELLLVHRFIYTGSVEILTDVAQDLLRAADQYLLEGLKRLCEYSIAQVGICVYLVLIFFSKLCTYSGHSKKVQVSRFSQVVNLDNIYSMYELSEAYNAVSLRQTCILFILEHFDKTRTRPW